MNLEEDRLVCGRRFPLQLGVALVLFNFFTELSPFTQFLNCSFYYGYKSMDNRNQYIKQAQRRAAKETAARKLIDPLLNSLYTFLVDQIRTFNRYCIL